MVVFGSLDQV